MGSKEDLIFYAVAGTIIGWLATVLGASIGVALFVSLIIPPILLIAYRIMK